MKREQIDFEISFFEKLVRTKPDFIHALLPLADAYTQKGLHEKALRIDRRLARLKPGDPAVQYNLACSFALIGKKDEALRALKRAIALGWEDWEHLGKDADLKSLHDDPRFKSLLSKRPHPAAGPGGK